MAENAVREARRRRKRVIGFVALIALLAVPVSIGLLLYRRVFPPVQHLYLPDRTEVWLYKASTFRVTPDFARTRTLEIDGEMLLKVLAGLRPLRIQSPVFVATVPADAVLVVSSFAKNPGAQVEVITGAADIEPAYRSRWHDSAHAVAGEIVMLSRDVDLMEHESVRPNDIPSWVGEYLPRSTAGHPRQ